MKQNEITSQGDLTDPFPLQTQTLNPFPETVRIEDLTVTAFPNPESLFERISQEAATPGQKRIAYLNVHVANTAFSHPELKRILLETDLIYCDGAGIVTASRLLGHPLPTRLTAADWFIPMLARLAEKGRRVYLLGGAPGVPEAALAVIQEHIPHHSVVGAHHGYILNDPALERRVIEEINALHPDILMVGFGTPLQEIWIDRHRNALSVPALYAVGAVMDFVSGRVPRCPGWMGRAGMEWLYRLYTEPRRLVGRYVIGNPWFFFRILVRLFLKPITGK